MSGALFLTVVLSSITPQLQEALNRMPPDQYIPVYVVLKQQVNPRELYQQVKDLPKNDRRARVIETLKSFSQETQAPSLEYLRSIGAKNIRPLWIASNRL